MAGPKEEWLIWDRRFQFGYSCLNQRMKKFEAVTQQIAQLDQQTKHLTASSRHLQEDNDGLTDKIQQLQQASYQIAQLDEQIRDLAASSGIRKEENNELNDRILRLEQEGIRRDQENRLVQEQLIEKLSVQEGDFKSVAVAMKGMHEKARAERGQRGEEIQQLRSQVGDLIATRRTPGWDARDASSESSQATAEDGWMPSNQRAEQQRLDAAHQDIEVQGVLIRAQASFTLFENHLRNAEKAFERYETEAVHAFVNSAREEYRIALSNKLEEHGGEWTWQAAREEGHRIVEAEKKTRRRSTRFRAGSSRPS